MRTERSERRASVRHRVPLPITLGDLQSWTRDISASGVFFTLHDRSTPPPALRERIRFRLTFEYADSRGPFHIDCEGDVVRVEVGPEAVGVAVNISAYDFDTSGVPSVRE